MELRMSTDLQTAFPQSIDFNFEEMMAELEERLHHYNTLVVTEDSIREAKADRAKLNKLKEALESKRKEVKKEVLKPFNGFEARIKELVALVDRPILAIDTQLSAYEEQRKEDKKNQIAEIYDATVPGELMDIIPLLRIYNPKWLNATTSLKSVKEEIEDIVKRTNADMMVLDTVAPEYAPAVREVYMRTLDITQAMAHRNALQAAAEAFKQREAAKAAQAPQPVAEPVKAAPTPVQEAPKQQEQLYSLRLEFHLTMEQSRKLKQFLTDNNIDYTKI